MMKSSEIRETFLRYFNDHNHRRVKSSSLIPASDPTLLFTNAGMVQFKDCFLGFSDLGTRRATTCQKCVRAGGKHNDLENVGFTARHHTFFEMLGNFSFGDYFKKDAIAFAWELLTQQYKLPKERLQVTVFKDDDEAFDLWKARGVPEKWITRLGEKDNFWAMGDTGPCGPCTEIYYDWGEKYGCGKKTCVNPGCECGTRFLEIWNLVFMQFNRSADGTMVPLPKPSVDTGAGLERLSAVLQGHYSNYDTDLFQPIIRRVASRVEKTYGKDEDSDVSMRVIADHMRAGSMLLSDGVVPSNEGRGYVLRRILRRAIRHGKKLGIDHPFLFELVETVTQVLGPVYPELPQNRRLVETLLKEEEVRFHETLHRGMGLLEEAIADLRKKHLKRLNGEIAFKLYDSFGFPVDLIEVICTENGFTVDHRGFETCMERQRSQSASERAFIPKNLEPITKVLESQSIRTQFVGYDSLTGNAKLMALFDVKGNPVDKLAPRDTGYAVVDKTPFYAESGGQVGDRGALISKNAKAAVQSTFRLAKAILHQIAVTEGTLAKSSDVHLSVDPTLRKFTANNHTATHLLHAALRKVLGDRVKQAGSLVDPDKLRFDFTFPRALTHEELSQIESMVNEHVAASAQVKVEEMALDDAMKTGAIAFFDEKYGDRVRVVRIGDPTAPFSIELCGGTHLANVGDIGLFKIAGESSVASGTRRIEAITSQTAFKFLLKRTQTLEAIESALSAKDEAALKKVEALSAQLRTLQKENEKLQLNLMKSGAGSGDKPLWEKSIEVKGVRIVREVVPSTNPKLLRSLVDQVRDKLVKNVAVLVVSETEGKVSLCVGLSKDLTTRWDAGKIIQPLAAEVGGTGGGKADFAQAGGTQPSGIPSALAKFESWVRENA